MFLCSLFHSHFYFKKGSSVASSSALSTTPLVHHNTSPFRKSISVGSGIYAAVRSDVLGKFLDGHHIGVLRDGERILLLGLHQVGV